MLRMLIQNCKPLLNFKTNYYICFIIPVKLSQKSLACKLLIYIISDTVSEI